MKNYGTDTVTPESLRRATTQLETAVDAVDQKQTKQIMALRWAVGISAGVNLLISLVLLMKVFG